MSEMQTYTPCLDKGFVRLVDWMGDDLSIVRNARVSFNAHWRAGENEGGDARLINFLMKHGHNTPFESVVFTFNIKAPIFVFRQWHRHRTQSYNEVSARYKELPEEYYIPATEVIGEQAKHNKQARTWEQERPQEELEQIQDMMANVHQHAFDHYHALLEEGVPRELARSVLPVGVYSEMFTTVNLHNLYRFLAERLNSDAQYEIRVYACALFQFAHRVAPVATTAFFEHQLPTKTKEALESYYGDIN